MERLHKPFCSSIWQAVYSAHLHEILRAVYICLILYQIAELIP